MTKIFKKIGNAQQDIDKINQNFDEIAIELANRSGVFSSVASAGAIPIADGESIVIEVDILDPLSRFATNRLPVLPRYDLFIDNDLDYTYVYPIGGNLTAAEVHGIRVHIHQSRVVVNEVADEKATIFIAISNDSGGAHNFYLYFDTFYVPSPELGIAVRATG